MADLRVRMLGVCALVAAVGVATSACPSPDFGPSEVLYDNFVADSTFTVIGNRTETGLLVGNDVAPGEVAVAFVAFDLLYARSYDILHQADVTIRQAAIQGSPFATGGTVVVDVLPESAYAAFQAGTLSPTELTAAEALVPRVGVLSDGPTPGDRAVSLSDGMTEIGYLSVLFLRVRFDPIDDANDAQDSVDFVGIAASTDPPRFDVAYQIAGH